MWGWTQPGYHLCCCFSMSLHDGHTLLPCTSSDALVGILGGRWWPRGSEAAHSRSGGAALQGARGVATAGRGATSGCVGGQGGLKFCASCRLCALAVGCPAFTVVYSLVLIGASVSTSTALPHFCTCRHLAARSPRLQQDVVGARSGLAGPPQLHLCQRP